MKLDVHIDSDLSASLQAEIVAAEKAVTVGVTRTGEALKAAWRTQVTSAGLGRRLANAICGLDQLLGKGKARKKATIPEGSPSILLAHSPGGDAAVEVGRGPLGDPQNPGGPF